MQTKPITPYHFVLIHLSYEAVFLVVGSQESYHIREMAHRSTSSLMIPTIKEMLEASHQDIKDISYCACTVGPGPLTTLRTIIATANGLGFATGIPLIELNTLEVFALSTHHEPFTHTFVLLNAFCNDVYYASYDGKILDKGSCSFETWLCATKSFIDNNPSAKIQILGNGAKLYGDQLTKACLIPAQALTTLQEMPPVQSMIHASQEKWTLRRSVMQLTPFYARSALPKL